MVGESNNPRSDNTYPNAMNGEYFYQRALGGAGFICAGGALIEPQGTSMRETPQINTHKHMLAWKTVVDKVHEAPGSVFYCQLWHCKSFLRHAIPSYCHAAN